MKAIALSNGSPEPLGLTLTEGGANIAVYSETAEIIQLCLFDPSGAIEMDRLVLPERTGPVFHGFVPGLKAGALYGLRATARAAQRGLCFNPEKLLIDPYALRSTGRSGCTVEFRWAAGDSAPFMPKAMAVKPLLAAPARRKIPWPDTVIYELHVRGFTKLLRRPARRVARNLRRVGPSRRARPSQIARRDDAGNHALRRLDRRAAFARGGPDQLLGL